MKIVLAGSPEIAVAAFAKVIDNFDVVAIVTQPDKPKGRGLKLAETPVGKLGREKNIKVFKPQKINEIKDDLAALDYDLFLTFAFGQYIPTTILSQGKYKPLNIHGSLLPKYRGAAPIHAAILNGDDEIGITLMEMVKEMDAGDMFFKAKEKITSETTTGDGFKIISKLAEQNIVQWLKAIFNNEVTPEKQPSEFTVQGKIEKSFAELSLNLLSTEAQRKVRGLNPFPGAYIIIEGRRLKVFNVVSEHVEGSIKLTFKDKELYVVDYQWEGKKRVVLK